MMIFLSIAGGVALIVFGTRFLRKGLDRLFGQGLVRWLQRVTAHPLKGFGAGIVAGVGTPSSTAVSLVAVQMLSSGQLCTERMLAVFLGANVGLTAPAQLLAFRVQDYAPGFLLVGVLGFQFLQRTLFRGIGQCLLALGFMFLGMQMIGQGAHAIAPEGELGQVLKMVSGHPWLVLATASVVTFFLQSSTAALGLGLGLAVGSHFSLPALLVWVLGANLGIGLTTLAAGWSSLEGRRMAGGNLLVKGVAVAGLMLLLPRLSLPALAGDGLAAAMVHFHTLFNLAVGLLCLPLVAPLARLMRAWVAPPPVTELAAPASYLDDQALESPALALANATREILAMADEVKLMLESCWRSQAERNRSLAATVHAHDDRIDDSAAEVTEYLVRISQEDLSEEEGYRQFALLSCVNELETIADIIDKNLCDFVRKQAAHGFPMTAEDEAVLGELYDRVRARCELVISLITTRDTRLAGSFLAGEEELEEWCRGAQRAHYERLRAGDERTLQSSVYFLDMLGSFRRINSHLATMAYAFADEAETPEPEALPARSAPVAAVPKPAP